MKPSADTEDTLRLAMLAHQDGKPQKAAGLYDEVLRIAPEHNRALRLRGVLARDCNDIELSLRLLTRAATLSPDDAQLLTELGLSFMAAGRLADACSALQEALSIHPDSVNGLVNLGALLHQRGHLLNAIDAYRRAMAMSPNDAQLRCNLAKALSDAGDGENAISECEAALEHSPIEDHSRILATRGAVLIDRELYSDARQSFAEAESLGAADDMMLVNLALAHCQLGDLPAAEASLQKALQLNPFNARATADLANVYCMNGRADDAAELCRNFLNRHPGERLILGAYALALHNAGNFKAAAELNNFDALVQVFDTDCPEEFESIEAFNEQITRELLADESLLHDPVSKSTFGGDQTGELDFDLSPAMAAFRNIIETTLPKVVEKYRSAGLENHPVMAPAYQSQTLRGWGTVLRSGGRQTSHMHPLGWLSGVYYTQLPEGMDSEADYAGWLAFNAPPERIYCEPAIETKNIEPAPGRMVIFPSWFWHRTQPFASDGERISIAFDIVPTAALRLL